MKMTSLGLILASTIALAACGGDKAGNTSKAGNTAAPASNSSSGSSNNAAPAAGGESGGSEAGDRTNQNFTLNNRSDQTVSHIYVSPVSDNNWGEDIMGQDVLAAGQSVQVSFERAETECNWDIRVTVEGDRNEELRNVNLCETTDVNYGG